MNNTLGNVTLIFETENSKIFLKETENTKEKRVLKMLKSEFPSAINLRTFRGELEITKDLTIPGIRKAFDYFQFQDRHTLELEYIEGKTLNELQKTQNTFSLEQFFPICIQIAELLSRIHAKNIIHKDLNGNNIIITENGQVTLIDFGIATVIELKTTNLKSPEKLEGTLTHISPEQTGRINRSVDTRTDLYSFGVIMHNMLCGKLPFDSSDLMELVHSHIAKIPTQLIEINTNIPKILSNIVSTLLEKNVDKRYQSANSLKSDLEKCFDEF